MELPLIKFIKDNPTWRDILKSKPYCIDYHTNPAYPALVLFKYNQIQSNFYDPVVKNCRGIILHIDGTTIIPVCIPFFKFGNYSEGYADTINWDTARVQEKIDGSLLKLWFYPQGKKWILSTNGTIDAFGATVPFPMNEIKTFGDAFLRATQCITLEQFMMIHELKVDYTYLFELIGPYNKVVVSYPLDLYHIGVRHNSTYQETPCGTVGCHIKKPKEYLFASLTDTCEFAKTLSSQEEGYVVVDNDWHRVKIKGTTYVQLHHLKGDVVNSKRIMTLILNGESGEFLNYFPEYTDIFRDIQDKYNVYVSKIMAQLDAVEELKKDILNGTKTRKEYANVVSKMVNQPVMYDFMCNKFEKSDLKLYLSHKSGPDRILVELRS